MTPASVREPRRRRARPASSILRRGDPGLQAGEETPLLLSACPAYLFGSFRISLVFMRTAYKCRAYPTPGQASVLHRTFGCVRLVWNRTLAWRHQQYHAEKAGTSLTQANAYLTAMKATDQLAWLNEVSSVPLQQAIRHQQVAYTAFFAAGPGTRVKSRQGRQPGVHPVRVPVARRRAVPGEDGHAAGVHVVLARRGPGVDRPDDGDGVP